MVEPVLIAVAVFAAGIALGWLLARRGGSQSLVLELRKQVAAAQQQNSALQGELRVARELRVAAETRSSEIDKNLAQQKVLLDEARGKLTETFKLLANEILEDKSRRFAELNQTGLEQLLQPLREKIGAFQQKVEEVHLQDIRERSRLTEQLHQLAGLNQQLSEDATNLTRALKGSSKVQGTWGELILERILEASGLRKGEEYEVQTRYEGENGKSAQPDVVIRLPEKKNLVVDSKVSLNAYEEYANGESDAERTEALKRHLQSVRSHIGGLSKRNYQTLYELPSLDFVVMFIPIEPAYALALGSDPGLWLEAWQKNVLLVGPSTLLFVVRTIATLWRQEDQNRNVQEIVRRGASLYDKLAAFVDDLEAVGTRLGQAQQSYDEAFRKLSTGRGNLIRQAEMLKELGVAPTRPLQQDLLDRAVDEQALPEMKKTATANAD